MRKPDAPAIVLTREQHVDEILRHWHLLWPLPRAERIRQIGEIFADLAYEDTLRAVGEAMSETAPRPSEKMPAYMLGAAALNVLLWFGVIVVAFEALRP